MVAISVDGTREAHDGFRGRSGSYDAAFEAMTALKAAGVPEVVAGTTVHRDNADLLASMAPDVLSSAADAWGLHLMTPEGRAGEHRELLPTAAQLRRVASFAPTHARGVSRRAGQRVGQRAGRRLLLSRQRVRLRRRPLLVRRVRHR